jgi:hypothetical protein
VEVTSEPKRQKLVLGSLEPQELFALGLRAERDAHLLALEQRREAQREEQRTLAVLEAEVDGALSHFTTDHWRLEVIQTLRKRQLLEDWKQFKDKVTQGE